MFLIATILRRLLPLLLAAVVVLNWTYGRLPVTPHPSGRFAQLQGVRIRYLERPGREPAVLLLHGLPGTADDFNAVTPLLAGERTIAIDRPGFGFSSGGYAPLDGQLRAIRELLARLGISRPIVVGHSYGGSIALAYAESDPGAVRGLVLVDAAAACTRTGLLEHAQARLVQALELPVIAQLADVTFSQLLRTVSAEKAESEAFAPNAVAPAHRARLLSINLKHGNLEAYAGEVLASNGVIEDVNRGLARIGVPTTVIQGDHDELVKPECGRRLAAGIPGAALEMVSGGHMVPYTHPDAVAAAVAVMLVTPGQRGRLSSPSAR
jgi:pimeloyl-ACP methyl ester carboxylesterase